VYTARSNVQRTVENLNREIRQQLLRWPTVA